MKRLFLVVLGAAVFMSAGVALAAVVGHITPVGHVDTVDLSWGTLVSDDVSLDPDSGFTLLTQGEGPAGTGDLGDLALPQDKAYNLTLLGGIDATKGTIGDACLGVTQLDALEGTLSAEGQNMLLFYNRDTGKWDGLAGSEFSIALGSSYDLEPGVEGIHAKVVAGRASEASSGGGGGGGCSAACLAAAALYLLAPLLLLKKRG